ncbi:hypothetical protein KDL01_09245 [Actinospica durhamensis]|uniref:Uncharacterized protein n=1 Tax=Actinospica durhamensis TaxID=1508375 RepID=A0A941EJ39_9ACTN|nr:hypothetical protein [Actinospica durhamensis]MBR7833450.1 hypothetical protein [Actinospica durhamensis]
MGLYNIVTAPVACRVCGLVSARDLQLHYGAKGMHHYQVGDRLQWGATSGPHEGDPDAPRVWCPCYAETPCPGCGDDDDRPGFALVIEEGVISAVFQAPPGSHYPQTPEWTVLAAAERPIAAADEPEVPDLPAIPATDPAVELQAALCAILGITDHDDKAGSAIKPTRTRILDTVARMRTRLEILTATDPTNTDLRASIDEHIRAGQNIYAVKTIREQLACSISEAVEILNDRFLILRQLRSDD